MATDMQQTMSAGGRGACSLPGTSQTPFELSVATTSKPAIISKSFVLESGELAKRPGGAMVRGSSERHQLSGLQNLAELLPKLTPSNALVYGCTTNRAVKIVTREKYQARQRRGIADGYVARTSDHFKFQGNPSLWILDIDREPNDAELSREEVLTRLVEAEPVLTEAGYVWWPSSSSHIINSQTGEDLTGLRGQRFWFLVNDGRGIPAAGKALTQRLWNAGHGHIKVSKSGALLERTLVDAMVWQPERLDFAGGAHCGAGLHQDRGQPVVVDGEVIDVSAFVPREAAA